MIYAFMGTSFMVKNGFMIVPRGTLAIVLKEHTQFKTILINERIVDVHNTWFRKEDYGELNSFMPIR